MCGICGIIRFDNTKPEEKSLQQMMQTMKHRGPDDEGVFIEKNIGLGFVRLSIIDLTQAGHQPMVSQNGDYVIVFNGEIYNYIEIKEELLQKGYRFKTKTDTEVLLNAYIEWGENCQNKFNGMWAFAILNRKNGEIFISRDRYGIKPFYYYADKNAFYFASEIPPLLKVIPGKPKANNQAIFDYLVFNRTDQTEQTFFEAIKKLQHGHQLSITNNRVAIKKWYNLRSNLKTPFQRPEEYKEMFSSAVSLRLRSDVPVGVCLSGGLDSSSIVSVLLNDYNKTDLNTFSAVYEKGQLGDETEYIKQYEKHLKNMFFTTPTAQTLYNDIEQFITLHAEPIPSTSPYAQFKVMQLAQKKTVVTLDGQGADEQLAGYHYFFGLFFKDLLKQRKILLLFKELIAYLKVHKSVYAYKTFIFFLLPSLLRTKLRVAEKGYLTKTFSKQYKNTNTIAGNLYASNSLQDALLDHFEYKLEHLLKWEDRNSMYFSLESRVPFLDYRLVEKTIALSNTHFINRGNTKNILREAMKNILPDKIRKRKDKNGFDTPQDKWLRSEKFNELVINILNSKSFKQRNIINPKVAMQLYKKHANGNQAIAKEIWKWINLEMWFRKYID